MAGVWTEFCGEEHLTSVIILKSNPMLREVNKIQKMKNRVSQCDPFYSLRTKHLVRIMACGNCKSENVENGGAVRRTR